MNQSASKGTKGKGKDIGDGQAKNKQVAVALKVVSSAQSSSIPSYFLLQAPWQLRSQQSLHTGKSNPEEVCLARAGQHPQEPSLLTQSEGLVQILQNKDW